MLDELEQLATQVIFLKQGRTVARPGDSTAASSADASAATSNAELQWRIRARDSAALDAGLRTAGVDATVRNVFAGDYRIVSLRDEAAAAALLSALVSEGAAITEFAPVSGTLEQAFLRLTTEESQ